MMLFVGCSKQPTKTVDFVAFDRDSACTIVVPEKATESEMRAAELLQRTLARTARRPRDDFLIVHRAPEEGMVLSVRGLADTPRSKLEEWVAWRVQPGRLELTAYPADAIEGAASWFLERNLGTRWFSPGAIGEHLPSRREVRLTVGETIFFPDYVSRSFSVGKTALSKAWWSRNRLRSWFDHAHAMSALFKPDDLYANPELAPTISGQKYFPADDRQQGWQPNILHPAAAEHAARRLEKRAEFSSALGMNDGIGYDQSEATRRAVDETKWFRMRPDFSPLVFHFTNEVAKRVPERYLGAYAYYWTEDTPPFKVEKNVVPYLTADRSEWLDPEFAEADKALIKRWVASGAEVVGLYDYYYGAPFFVPRPTLYAATEVIPWAYEAGVRAFYAEANSNWALDGPKAWLAAQLLWDSKASSEALLNTYYSEFWREAAGPMREFYALCDEQWRHQPKPTYWIKYYKDEHQYLLFPREVRQRLRALLERAMAGATTELTRNRVRFASAGFQVTEEFCTWQETKEALSRAVLETDVRPERLRALSALYGEQLDGLKRTLAEVKQKYPDAIQAELIGEYTRNDPRRKAEWRLGERSSPKPEAGGAGGEGVKPEGVRILSSNPQTPTSSNPPAADPHTFTPSHPHILSTGRSPAVGPELLRDADLAQLVVGPTSGYFDLNWAQSAVWSGSGEPYQGRKVFKSKPETGNLRPDDGGRRTEEGGGGEGVKPEGVMIQSSNPQTLAPSNPSAADPRTLTPSHLHALAGGPPVAASIAFTGCKRETLAQWAPAMPGKTYVARVKVRAKVSPGNMTYLILNFQDEKRRTLGIGFLDRLPVGEYGDSVELIVTAVAPSGTAWVGLGAMAQNQVADDYVAFSGFSLREAAAP